MRIMYTIKSNGINSIFIFDQSNGRVHSDWTEFWMSAFGGLEGMWHDRVELIISSLKRF